MNEDKGYIVIIRRSKMKKRSTFEYKLKSILEEAKRLERGVFWFPNKLYFPPGVPEKVLERYPQLQITAEDMARSLVKLAVEHGVPIRDIFCYEASLKSMEIEELVRKKLNETYPWKYKSKATKPS